MSSDLFFSSLDLESHNSLGVAMYAAGVLKITRGSIEDALGTPFPLWVKKDGIDTM